MAILAASSASHFAAPPPPQLLLRAVSDLISVVFVVIDDRSYHPIGAVINDNKHDSK